MTQVAAGDDRPWLRLAPPRRGPTLAIAVVLHGGQERSIAPTSTWQPAVLRMLPFARALRREGGRRGLAVARLRYRARGWNAGADPDATPAPVADLREALDRLADAHPGVPIALIGHSMGGRAALRGAGHPAVRAVAALAPWIAFGEPFEQLADRDLLVVHGAADRRTDPVASRHYADAAARSGARASYIAIEGAKHAMLEHPSFWHAITARYVASVLPELHPEGRRPRGRRDETLAALARTAAAGGLRTTVDLA